jgi:hypothetical protein
MGAVKEPLIVVVVSTAGARHEPLENCRVTFGGIVQLVAIVYVTG